MCIAHKHLKYAPIILPSTYKELGEAFCSPVFKNFVTMHKPMHMAAVYFALYL